MQSVVLKKLKYLFKFCPFSNALSLTIKLIVFNFGSQQKNHRTFVTRSSRFDLSDKRKRYWKLFYLQQRATEAWAAGRNTFLTSKSNNKVTLVKLCVRVCVSVCVFAFLRVWRSECIWKRRVCVCVCVHEYHIICVCERGRERKVNEGIVFACAPLS